MKLRNPEGALTEAEKPIVKALLFEGWRNQDIQALLNIGRDATVNSARITEVKQNNKIQPASAPCDLFGPEVSLQKELSFALQFAKLSIDQISTLEKYELPEEMEALDARLREGLTGEELTDLEYQFRVVFTLDASTKSKSHIQFVHPDSKEAEQIRNVLVKHKPADELYPHKPSRVVQLVSKKAKNTFTSHNHTQAWRKYRARPQHRSVNPANTNKDYCIYHSTHGDYTYSDRWVEFLVEMVSDADEFTVLKKWK